MNNDGTIYREYNYSLPDLKERQPRGGLFAFLLIFFPVVCLLTLTFLFIKLDSFYVLGELIQSSATPLAFQEILELVKTTIEQNALSSLLNPVYAGELFLLKANVKILIPVIATVTSLFALLNLVLCIPTIGSKYRGIRFFAWILFFLYLTLFFVATAKTIAIWSEAIPLLQQPAA